MSRTISANVPGGLTLTNTGDNPIYIAQGVIVSNPSGPAVINTAPFYWSVTTGPNALVAGTSFGVSLSGAGRVTNNGSITASYTAGPGFSYNTTTHVLGILSAGLYVGGGEISNAASGVVSGVVGLALGGLGSIVNAGVLRATVDNRGFGAALGDGGSVTNLTGGSIAGGLYGILTDGAASVSNQSGATITGTMRAVFLINGGTSVGNQGVISGGGYGIGFLGSAGTVTNQGSISGTTGAAVNLAAGGSVTNAVGGTLAGGQYGVRIRGIPGSVTNQGSITATTVAGVGLAAGGSVVNAATGTVSGGYYGVLVTNAAGSVSNQGVLDGAGVSGIFMSAGGTVANLPGGTISGGYAGVVVQGADGSVTNSGAIRGIVGFTNQTFALGGVVLLDGGSADNEAGTISGTSYGVYVSGAAGTVTNTGLISTSRASGGSGVFLGAGGTVNNNGGTITSATYGIYVAQGPGTITNSGRIATSTLASGGGGVLLSSGGTVANTGSITSRGFSVRVRGAAGTVTNSGIIASFRTGGGAGAALEAGGSLTNAAGGIIDGEWIGVQTGVFASSTQAPAATIDNSGSISAADGSGSGAAVWVHGPGVIINRASGVIQGATQGIISGGPLNGLRDGGFGIVAYYQTTVINYGSIAAGTYSSAAYHYHVVGPKQFAFDAANKNPTNTISNLIEMAPGASFGGVVKASSGIGSATLELLSGGSAGTIESFGKVTVSGIYYRGYLGFGAVKIDDGARWTLGGTVAAGTTVDFSGSASLTFASATQMQGTIANFAQGDMIELDGISATGSSYSAGVLTLTGTSGTVDVHLAGNFAINDFVVTSGAGITDISVAQVSCFAAGTTIRTEQGPVPVEHLAPGMRVVTRRGDTAEIVWIGERDVDCRRHPAPMTVYPIRIRAGAFGPDIPSRDLWLSPDHAIFVDDVLIPVHCLLNGVTIRRMTVPEVRYFHVELASHDVILAEDLPVESYLDTGDRANFSNSGGPARLFPDFSARMWEMMGCAPLVMNGPVLERVKRALARNEVLITNGVSMTGQRRRTPWTRLNNRYTYY